MWFQNVTLQSVNDAAGFFDERMPYKPNIYYFLRLEGTYLNRSLPTEEWATRFPHVQIIVPVVANPTTMKQWLDNSAIQIGGRHINSTLSFTRLDADDSIARDFFYQLADLKKMADFSKEIVVSGSDTLAMLELGKTEDGKNIYCHYSLHSRPYLMSIGLTVTLHGTLWKKVMNGRIYFENHTKVRSFVLKLLENAGYKVNVREVHLSHITGLYLKTELSSRHETMPNNVTNVPCDRNLMDRRVGMDNAKILWSAVLASIPTLTSDERMQNIHMAKLLFQAAQQHNQTFIKEQAAAKQLRKQEKLKLIKAENKTLYSEMIHAKHLKKQEKKEKTVVPPPPATAMARKLSV